MGQQTCNQKPRGCYDWSASQPLGFSRKNIEYEKCDFFGALGYLGDMYSNDKKIIVKEINFLGDDFYADPTPYLNEEKTIKILDKNGRY